MTKEKRKPLTRGEKSRMIRARKDCIMKKVEELQNLTELGACLIIQLPDGKFETWPKDGDKLQEVYQLYQENLKSVQMENTNQAERSSCLTDPQSCHESSAGLKEGVERVENKYLASDYGKHDLGYANEDFSGGEQLLPWHETMHSLLYSGTEAYSWFDESYKENMIADTTLYENTMFRPLQYCYPETNFGYITPQPTRAPGLVSNSVATISSFESTESLDNNRTFQPYIQEVLGIAVQEDLHHASSATGSWSTMPREVFTQYHADHMGGSMHNGSWGYRM